MTHEERAQKIEELLKQLPKECAGKAIANFNNPDIPRPLQSCVRISKDSTPAEALNAAFVWDLAPEGNAYWGSVYQSLISV